MRQVMRDDPMKDLKVLLHCEEDTDVDAVIVEAIDEIEELREQVNICLLYTSPSPRDLSTSRMPSSA